MHRKRCLGSILSDVNYAISFYLYFYTLIIFQTQINETPKTFFIFTNNVCLINKIITSKKIEIYEYLNNDQHLYTFI